MLRLMPLLACAVLFMVSCEQESSSTVKKTNDGHEYVLHVDAGGEKPQPGEYVVFDAFMRNGDSVIFSTVMQGQAPTIQIPTGEDTTRQLTPIEDLLMLLGSGDSATLNIRIDTLDPKPRGFENADILYYDIAVREVQTEEDYQAAVAERQAEEMALREEVLARKDEVFAFAENVVEQYNNNQLDDQIQTTPSGLKYIIHEEGSGPKPAAQQMVSVHYYGSLLDGTVFDNSFERGAPISFPVGVGQVIQGWDEGLMLLNKGSKATFFIPANLGYGEAGSGPIPANAELIFYVEVDEE